MLPMLIGIDPGQNGGIAWQDEAGDVSVMRMPDTPLDIFQTLLGLTTDEPLVDCYIENVGGYRPGNSGPAAVKFGRHCGHLEMALLAAQIRHHYIAPSVWMRKVLNTVPSDKKERKNKIKREMQRLYPELRVTLWGSDALGLLTHGILLGQQD